MKPASHYAGRAGRYANSLDDMDALERLFAEAQAEAIRHVAAWAETRASTHQVVSWAQSEADRLTPKTSP